MFNIRCHRVLVAGILLCGSLMPGQTATYDQPYRPQIHFSPRHNWTNDPNGLVYFPRRIPFVLPIQSVWRRMGPHELGTCRKQGSVALARIASRSSREADGVMIFTGSVVVDRETRVALWSPGNSSDRYFQHREIAIPLNGHRQTQNIAYSLDNGRNWTSYAGNPVLDLHMSDFRDPSVSWNEQARSWVMAVSLPKEHKVRFYSSPNLKEWTQLSDFGPEGDVGGDWECPDLLRIPSENDKESVWALKVGLNPGAPQGGSGEQYFLGSFDGKSFRTLTEPGAHGWTNYGKDDYCAISYNDMPKGDKPVLIGWMNNWQYAAKVPTSPWRGQMSLPRQLSFVRDSGGLALKQDPVIAPLRGQSLRLAELLTSKDGGGSPIAVPYELQLNFGHPIQPIFGLRLFSDKQHWTEIGFDIDKKQFYIDRTRSGEVFDKEFPTRTVAPVLSSRPYDQGAVDRSSVEAFAQDGTIAMTDLIYSPSPGSSIQVFPVGIDAATFSGRGWKLNSIWKQ